MMRSLILVAFLASAAGAETLPSPLAPFICHPHADLVAALKGRGQTLYAAGSLADGRKLEVYADPVAGIWTSVVVQRPKGGSVTKATCSIIFGEGDPGVLIPAGPLP